MKRLGSSAVLATAIAISALSALSACNRVKPYQRGTLASPSMRAAPWPSTDRADAHVFEVREGTRGATGNAGGGCGCN